MASHGHRSDNLNLCCTPCRNGRHDLCLQIRRDSLVSPGSRKRPARDSSDDLGSNETEDSTSATNESTDAEELEDEGFQYPFSLRKILDHNNWKTAVFAYELSALQEEHSYIDITPICGRCLFKVSQAKDQVKRSSNHAPNANPRIEHPPNSDSAHLMEAVFDLHEGSEQTNCLCFELQQTKKDRATPNPLQQTVPNLGRVPVEVWENILQYLSREDVKTLRLASKTIEKSVSGRLFKTVVVPFTAELLSDSNVGLQSVLSPSWLAKGRGINVFSGFGPHVQNFGMSFEVRENSLIKPPVKSMQQGHESYWGTYDWPFPQYARFKDRAELEFAADDTCAMKRAFSFLTKVSHLALSIDSGLGWLNGPDKTLKSQVFSKESRVFGSSFGNDSTMTTPQKMWSLIEHACSDSSSVKSFETLEFAHVEESSSQRLSKMVRNKPTLQISREKLIEPFLERCGNPGSLVKSSTIGRQTDQQRMEDFLSAVPKSAACLESELSDVLGDGVDRRHRAEYIPIGNQSKSSPPEPSAQRATLQSSDEDEVTQEHESRKYGLLYVRSIDANSSTLEAKAALIPRNLTKAQKEWLLESAWAQDAFLSSYLLAIVDNSTTFSNVTQLTISRLSSRHLTKLRRREFWQILQSAASVTIQVIADYRDVRKAVDGSVEALPLGSTSAITEFHLLLQQYITTQPYIKTLNIGWINGGEHAEGIFARNRQILPAPVVPSESMSDHKDAFVDSLVRLPHVQKLILSNCWMSPTIAESFLSGHNSPQLQSLTLESVSLTADARTEMEQLQNQSQVAQGNWAQNGHINPWTAVRLQLSGHQIGLSHRLSHILSNIPMEEAQQIFNHVLHLYNGVVLAHPHPHLYQYPQLQPQFQSLINPQQRVGLWVDLLQRIKLSREAREYPKLSLNCRSCGYVRLTSSRVPQSSIFEGELEFNVVNRNTYSRREGFFNERRAQLSEVMMRDRDGLHGQIAAALVPDEMSKLHEKWRFMPGWPTSDVEGVESPEDDLGKWGKDSRKAVESDGGRPAGTGRFSGAVSNFLGF